METSWGNWKSLCSPRNSFPLQCISDKFRMDVSVIKPGTATLGYMLVPNQANHYRGSVLNLKLTNFMCLRPMCPSTEFFRLRCIASLQANFSTQRGRAVCLKALQCGQAVRKGDNPFRSSRHVPCLEQWCSRHRTQGVGDC
jgi:hypothetical protein